MDGIQLRKFAHQCLPPGLRSRLGFCFGQLCNGLWKLRRPAMMRYYASAAGERHRLTRLQALRKKERIGVVFQLENIAKWKADSLLRLMLQHPRFTPVLRYVPFVDKEDAAYERNAAPIREYAARLGVPCPEFSSYNNLPAGVGADIVFMSEPYDGSELRRPCNEGLLKRFVCYIPYGFFSIGTDDTMNQIINNAALFNFYENSATYRLAAALMANGAANVAITGHTMADAFLYSDEVKEPAWKDCGPGKKKVIWAPHWTTGGAHSFFASGNFTDLAETMTELARRHEADMQFAFKPHPLLYKTLCEHPDWGAEKTQAYYRRWAEMPNTQLESGRYAALFMQSDAIVHDSSSFIIEYMFADKPAFFIRKGEGFQGYSAMAFEALKCYHKGSTAEEIEQFLQRSVLGGEDPFAAVRTAFRQQYLIPPHGVSAAQNVIDCLLGQGAYAGTQA